MTYPMDWEEHLQSQIDALVSRPVPRPFKKLAVIGNGFDRALGVPSSYGDFRAYFGRLTRPWSAEVDDELAEIYQVVGRAAGPEWQDFEEALGEIDLPREVAELDYADQGDLSELEGLMQAGSEYADTFRTRLSDVFTDWIHDLPGPDASQATSSLRALVDEADGLLVFNYTRTLEDLFGVPPNKVLHVHGVVDGPGELYFGCPPPHSSRDAGGSYSVSLEARSAALSGLITALTKVPRLELLGTFLANAGSLSAITSFGFSFGEADYEYTSAIVGKCNGDTVWTAHCHSAADADRARQTLGELGFPGRIHVG